MIFQHELDDTLLKANTYPYNYLTLEMFNEHNAVFKDNKKVADNPKFPLCAENETYQNEVRELFYEIMQCKEIVERMNNLNTPKEIDKFFDDMTSIFIETLFHRGWSMTEFIEGICEEFSQEATDCYLNYKTKVYDRVYPKLNDEDEL